jgi:hypothetical protein
LNFIQSMQNAWYNQGISGSRKPSSGKS